MLALNAAGTHYTKQGLRRRSQADGARPTPRAERSGKPHDGRGHERVPRRPRPQGRRRNPDVKPGRYLVDDDGQADVPDRHADQPRSRRRWTTATTRRRRSPAPQPQLFAIDHRGHPRRHARVGPGHHRRADRRGAGTVRRVGAAGRRRHVPAARARRRRSSSAACCAG